MIFPLNLKSTSNSAQPNKVLEITEGEDHIFEEFVPICPVVLNQFSVFGFGFDSKFELFNF